MKDTATSHSSIRSSCNAKQEIITHGKERYRQKFLERNHNPILTTFIKCGRDVCLSGLACTSKRTTNHDQPCGSRAMMIGLTCSRVRVSVGGWLVVVTLTGSFVTPRAGVDELIVGTVSYASRRSLRTWFGSKLFDSAFPGVAAT